MKKQSVLCKSMSKRELEALVSLSDNELPVLLLTNIVNIKARDSARFLNFKTDIENPVSFKTAKTTCSQICADGASYGHRNGGEL